jgi:hypothetical protein
MRFFGHGSRNGDRNHQTQMQKMKAIVHAKNLKIATIESLNNPDTRADDLAVIDAEFDRYLSHLVSLGEKADVEIEINNGEGRNCWEWSDESAADLWEEIQDEGFWAWYN